ncbi:hypothetical protein C1C98_10370 [Pseudomonas ogarae]|uniref:DUF1534 domain-containing protein n=1 Tax=Pseudomonas ogarae (strain DSM 112162 / CECT 30235 / F113) TaxID=1114970 RepID=A0ABN5G4M1_PSEO1|nr:hypothetical protein C1C98_10370 [Pseudomonas ogarae]
MPINPASPCGSGLARESGGSACDNVGCAAAFASKLCSHRSCSNRSEGCTTGRARSAVRPPRGGR